MSFLLQNGNCTNTDYYATVSHTITQIYTAWFQEFESLIKRSHCLRLILYLNYVINLQVEQNTIVKFLVDFRKCLTKTYSLLRKVLVMVSNIHMSCELLRLFEVEVISDHHALVNLALQKRSPTLKESVKLCEKIITWVFKQLLTSRIPIRDEFDRFHMNVLKMNKLFKDGTKEPHRTEGSSIIGWQSRKTFLRV